VGKKCNSVMGRLEKRFRNEQIWRRSSRVKKNKKIGSTEI
jgi:hypothetical protein